MRGHRRWGGGGSKKKETPDLPCWELGAEEMPTAQRATPPHPSHAKLRTPPPTFLLVTEPDSAGGHQQIKQERQGRQP